MKTLRYAIQNKNPDISFAKAIWIWFWYNDITRFVFPLMGLHLLLTIAAVASFGLNQNLDGEVMRYGLIVQYLVVFLWAMVDNDYENLNKVGLSVERRPLLNKSTKEFGA